MDYHNNPLLTSFDPLDYDPISLDDELLQLISSVNSPIIPQNNVNLDDYDDNVSANDHVVIENQAGDQNTPPLLLINSSSSVDHGHDYHGETLPPQQKEAEERNKKSKAVETERKRRQVMSSLCQDLRSLLPLEIGGKRKRSTSDLLLEATNYINKLKAGIKELNDRKKMLSTVVRSADKSSSSSNTNYSNQQQKHHVTVKPRKDGLIEVIIGTSNAKYDNDDNHYQSPRLSKVLNILSKEGLNVINCVFSRVDDDLIHTIQAQVDGDGRVIDLGLLQQTLTLMDCY